MTGIRFSSPRTFFRCRHRQQHRAARKDGASLLLVAELISAVAIYLLMLDQLKVFIFSRTLKKSFCEGLGV